MKHTTMDGTQVVFTDKMEQGKFQFCRQFLFVGLGTDLLELAEALDRFDEQFFKAVGITPYDTNGQIY
jgi:hypothetical protein